MDFDGDGCVNGSGADSLTASGSATAPHTDCRHRSSSLVRRCRTWLHLRGCRHKHARHPRCQVRGPSCRRRPQHLSLTRLVSPRHHRPLGPRRHPLGNSSPSSGDGRSRCPPSTRSRTCASSKSCAEEQGYHAGLRSLPASAPPRLCWPRPPPCRISTRTIEGMAAMNTHTHVMRGGHRRRVPRTPHQHFRLWPSSATRCSFLGAFFLL
jgi:hypothetical protein